MFTYLKIAMVAIVLAGIGGAYIYVKNLQADLATSEANNVKLEFSVGEQKKVIEQQLKDIKKVQIAMKDQAALNERLNASIKDLSNKFHKLNSSGKKRDIGNLAEKKPGVMQRAINRGTKNALRCMEIAMGAELTEKEKNAKTKSQINPECSDIANPNYVPYSN